MKLTEYGYEYPGKESDEFRGDIKTAQEHFFMGGSPSLELCKTPEDFYVPACVLDGSMNIEEATEARRKIGFTNTNAFGGLGLHKGTEGNNGLAMFYRDLNPVTGQTVGDPEFGMWDLEKQHIILKPNGRDLNEEFYEFVRKLPDNYLKGFKLLRDSKGNSPETQQPSKLEGN